MAKCNRCGNCCRNTGTIWTNSPHPLIKAISLELPDEYFRDYADCTMLVKINDQPACLIHQYLGFKAKPLECRDHEGDERCVKVTGRAV